MDLVVPTRQDFAPMCHHNLLQYGLCPDENVKYKLVDSNSSRHSVILFSAALFRPILLCTRESRLLCVIAVTGASNEDRVLK